MITRSHFGIIFVSLILPFLPLSAWSQTDKRVDKVRCGHVIGGPLNGKSNVEWDRENLRKQKHLIVKFYSLLPVDRESLDFGATHKTFDGMILDGNLQDLPKVDSAVISTYLPSKPIVLVYDDTKPTKVDYSTLKGLGILERSLRNWEDGSFVYKAKNNQLYNIVTNKRSSWGQGICVWAKPHGKNRINYSQGRKEYWLLTPSWLGTPYMKPRDSGTKKMSGVVVGFFYTGPVTLNAIDAVPGFTFE